MPTSTNERGEAANSGESAAPNTPAAQAAAKAGTDGPAGTATTPVTESDVASGQAPRKIGGGGPPLGDEAPVTSTAAGAPVQGSTAASGKEFTTPDGAMTDRPPAEEQPAERVAVPLKHYTNSRQRLTEEKLRSMSKPEIRAVAHDRGYDDLGLGGKSVLIARFLRQQEDFDDLDLHEAGSLPDQPVIRDETGTHAVEDRG